MNGLSWHWISLQLAVPPVVGVLLAYPFWRKSQPIFGNIVGTAVIFLRVEESIRRRQYAPEWQR